MVLYQAVGCSECSGTGYRGRTAILEFLTISDPIRRLILKHADAGELQAMAIAEGTRTMFQDGVEKALAGVTTLEDVLRVTTPDDGGLSPAPVLASVRFVPCGTFATASVSPAAQHPTPPP